MLVGQLVNKSNIKHPMSSTSILTRCIVSFNFWCNNQQEKDPQKKLRASCRCCQFSMITIKHKKIALGALVVCSNFWHQQPTIGQHKRKVLSNYKCSWFTTTKKITQEKNTQPTSRSASFRLSKAIKELKKKQRMQIIFIPTNTNNVVVPQAASFQCSTMCLPHLIANTM
jgi:hypothetical protein